MVYSYSVHSSVFGAILNHSEFRIKIDHVQTETFYIYIYSLTNKKYKQFINIRFINKKSDLSINNNNTNMFPALFRKIQATVVTK